MTTDFYYAFNTGWSILFFFWIFTLIFIYIRKPKNSKLTKKLTLFSIFFFIIGYAFIFMIR